MINSPIIPHCIKKKNRYGINDNIPKNRSTPKPHTITLDLPPTKKHLAEDLVDHASDNSSVISTFSDVTTSSFLSTSNSPTNIFLHTNNNYANTCEKFEI